MTNKKKIILFLLVLFILIVVLQNVSAQGSEYNILTDLKM